MHGMNKRKKENKMTIRQRRVGQQWQQLWKGGGRWYNNDPAIDNCNSTTIIGGDRDRDGEWENFQI